MPRVNLCRDKAAEAAEIARRTIRSKMALRGIDSQADLAEKIEMDCCTISRKMKNGRWLISDIARLDNVLRFEAEDIAKIVRGR